MSQTRFTTVLGVVGRFALAAVISSTILGGTARVAEAAEPTDEAKSLVVSTSGLDLGKSADRARLNQRIKAAAHKVCWEPLDFDLEHSGAFMSCYRAAIESARPGVAAAIAAAEKTNMVASASQLKHPSGWPPAPRALRSKRSGADAPGLVIAHLKLEGTASPVSIALGVGNALAPSRNMKVRLARSNDSF